MTRIEHDTMGPVEVPDDAYYGAQTQRAVENFPISGRPLPVELIRALGLVKWACVQANWELGMFTEKVKRPLSEKEFEAIKTAAWEVYEGRFDDQFPIDVYQTGSGTSTNMNANEVIANRANEILGFALDVVDKPIHPNDHVNLGQSTNDIFPTAIHVALMKLLLEKLKPVAINARDTLTKKAKKWEGVLKIGRTHLADATPMTLGQEFGGFREQMAKVVRSVNSAINSFHSLPVGGTAVGTGINTHPHFGQHVAKLLSCEKCTFFSAFDHFEANAQRDGLVTAHALLKSIASTLFNVANNIRWLGSGPRCGFYEVIIPDLQPGSSIMPGKVNPVLCEALMQACARVIGNDQTITFCGAAGGQFQLNIMMPVMADTAIESVKILAGALEVFTEKCLKGLEANEEKCRESVEKSLSMVTALNPIIGYEKAAALAKEAFKTGKTIRELCEEQQILPPDQLAEALDPMKMTRPLE